MFTVQINDDNGKISGTIQIPQGTLPIRSGAYAGGKLTLKFEVDDDAGTITAEYKDGKIVGTWATSDDGGAIEVKRVDADVTTSKNEAQPVASDAVSGVWECLATFDGGSLAFTLTLKVENGKVSGESKSERGTSTVSNGSFVGGKLNITLDGANGKSVLTGAHGDGKLSGDFDYADGQVRGKWAGKRTN